LLTHARIEPNDTHTRRAAYTCPMARDECTIDGICFCESESLGAITLLTMILSLVATVGACCYLLTNERRQFEDASAAMLQVTFLLSPALNRPN
jgi:hypothetical protein